MANEERSLNTQTQFPKIPKERVDEFISEVWIKGNIDELHAITKKFERQDPHLFEVIQVVAETEAHGNSVNFINGASIAYGLLTASNLPQVSEETISTYIEEQNDYKPQEAENIFFEAGIGNEVINPGLSTYQYAEENPSIMVFISLFPNEALKVGAMIVYELKRRQFHATRLNNLFTD